MNSKLLKQGLAIYVIAGSMFFPSLVTSVHAKEVIGDYCNKKVEASMEQYQNAISETYQGTAYANISGFAHIRSGPSTKDDWVGRIYKGNRVDVIRTVGEWSEVNSGEVHGYLKTEFIAPEEDQSFPKDEYISTVANVTAHVLNVRAGQGTDTPVIDQVTLGTKQTVTGEEQNGWVPVQVGEQQGYVYSRYVELEQQYSYAVSKEESLRPVEQPQESQQEEGDESQGVINIEETSLNEAKLDPIKAQEAQGQAVIDYACQFIGNPYVWGGTDLENGADCSGFVQSVYKHFGVELPRTSGEQRGAGVEVAYEEAMPGDIICYDGHVGLYMGEDKIVNAIGRKYGIDISSATYKKILSVRRVL